MTEAIRGKEAWKSVEKEEKPDKSEKAEKGGAQMRSISPRGKKRDDVSKVLSSIRVHASVSRDIL